MQKLVLFHLMIFYIFKIIYEFHILSINAALCESNSFANILLF